MIEVRPLALDGVDRGAGCRSERGPPGLVCGRGIDALEVPFRVHEPPPALGSADLAVPEYRCVVELGPVLVAVVADHAESAGGHD
ncbi:MAG: hypothetical protein ACRDQX_01535, partial [Pseudonocardiaceae bacterium]